MTEDQKALAVEYRKLETIREYLKDHKLTPKDAFKRLGEMLKS